MDSIVVEVVVPRPLAGPLWYQVPENLIEQVKLGSFVKVPLKTKSTLGFVVGFIDPQKLKSTGRNFELKNISECSFPGSQFSQKDLEFFNWIANYYQLPIGEVYYSAFPKTLFTALKRKPKPQPLADASARASTLELTFDQNIAIGRLREAFLAKRFKSFLLFGVTGSGKTEVYIHAASEALNLGRTALILVPEIALTPQLRARFEERFGENVSVLHSSLSLSQRRTHWWNTFSQKKKLVVGARSALFAPLQNIGVIIVDEEHEPSYKQEDRLRYSARDLALVRARQHNAIVILGSATPSIETYHAASTGKHELLVLNTRPNHRPMPTIEVIDLKSEPREFDSSENGRVLLGQKLRAGLIETLDRGEQAIVFVNRKGFASFLICQDCGHVVKCLNCSVSLTYYRNDLKMRCHYCGFETQVLAQCEQCHSFSSRFMGMGTERVEDEIQRTIPQARLARLDASTVSTGKKLEELLKKFRNRQIDILVGTQMVAKGHDFPDVTFVGIVLADLNLHLPDFRASERTFQLLAQVAGRCGRDQKPGRVVLQTFLPSHHAIQAAAEQNYLKFYAAEIEERKAFGYPPFSRMALIEFRDLKEIRAREQAEKIGRLLGQLKADFTYLGPASASIAKVANQYRWKILLKSEKIASLNSIVKTLRREGVRFIDVDPIATL